MDSLFTEMGNPIILLNGVIKNNQFRQWVDAHNENQKEHSMWEFYLNKLGVWDQRSFAEFKNDMISQNEPPKEDLGLIISDSFNLLHDFEIGEN